MKILTFAPIIATLTLLSTGCTTDGDETFPGLYGSESQEKILEQRSNSVYDSYTGTVLGQKIAEFRNQLTLLLQKQNTIALRLNKIDLNVGAVNKKCLQSLAYLEKKSSPKNESERRKLAKLCQNSRDEVANLTAIIDDCAELMKTDENNIDEIQKLGESLDLAFNENNAVDNDYKQLENLRQKTAQLLPQAMIDKEKIAENISYLRQLTSQYNLQLDNFDCSDQQ